MDEIMRVKGDGPNGGCTVKITKDTGFNHDIYAWDDPDWRQAVLLDGPNKGKHGGIRFEDLEEL